MRELRLKESRDIASGRDEIPIVAADAVKHLVLCGDSTFANTRHVDSGQDVIGLVRDALGDGWQASAHAVEGASTSEVETQIRSLPADATHAVLSMGGNDLMQISSLLTTAVGSMTEALEKIAEMQDGFSGIYDRTLDAILARAIRVAVCTVYVPRLPKPRSRRVTTTAIGCLNEVVIRKAFARELSLIDLNAICVRESDFANRFEPSVSGGRRIADAIRRFASSPEQDHSYIIGEPAGCDRS